MCLALVLVVAGLAMLYVALPAIAKDLAASQSGQQWIVDAYALPLAALLLPAGALGDRYGRRGCLLAGIACFGVACGFSALAWSPGTLIFWRAVAGVGAALIMPATLSTITSVFPEEERARAVGVWVGFAGGGAVIGMVTAGALLEAFWWGSCFLVAAGFSAVALLATLATVPRTSNPEHANLDPLGVVLSVVAIGALVFAIIEGPERGWTEPLTLSAFTAAGLAAGAFGFWERRTPAPLLDPRLFSNRGFATGTVSLVLLFVAMFGFFLVFIQFLQLVMGHSALKASLLILPMMFVMLPLATVAATLTERYGMRAIAGTGLVISSVGLAFLGTLEANSSYWQILPGFILVGAGIALAMTPGTNAIVAALPVEKQGVASAVNDAAREIGAALGVAILGSAFNAGYRGAIGGTLGHLPAEMAEVLKASPAGGLFVASQLGLAGAPIVKATQAAFVVGMRWSLFLAAALLLVGALYVWWRAPPRAARGETTEELAAGARPVLPGRR